MGAGIAQVALQAGLQVTLVDVAAAAVEKGTERIRAGLGKLKEKGKLDDARLTQALSSLRTGVKISELKDVDFAIEAVPENEELKRKILKELDAVVKPGGVLATNTSSISITRLATATSRAEAVIGMHFMNPVSVSARVVW